MIFPQRLPLAAVRTVTRFAVCRALMPPRATLVNDSRVPRAEIIAPRQLFHVELNDARDRLGVAKPRLRLDLEHVETGAPSL